ncbi:hypothetical protein [Streptomyces sp. NBC_00887]|uniref:hypothetical protein n=1 Tax=Streptomyces sp. NBC_00887 TaxID=2975859 RepID=UPI00386E98BC|nr:hypothetical protein OG844_07300 [Streptomyces sp. NBC_00887]WSY35152.1 hypothetical protein OG844_38300 [Streptomyces sp. NBC_00887]
MSEAWSTPSRTCGSLKALKSLAARDQLSLPSAGANAPSPVRSLFAAFCCHSGSGAVPGGGVVKGSPFSPPPGVGLPPG